jgi:cell division septal protein FtsQ
MVEALNIFYFCCILYKRLSRRVRTTHVARQRQPFQNKKTMWLTLFIGVVIALIVLLVIRLSEITTRMKTFEKFVVSAVSQEDLKNALVGLKKFGSV